LCLHSFAYTGGSAIIFLGGHSLPDAVSAFDRALSLSLCAQFQGNNHLAQSMATFCFISGIPAFGLFPSPIVGK